MNKINIALTVGILCIIIAGMTCGAAYATWTYNDTLSISNTIGTTVPDWNFVEDTDFAKIGYVNRDNCAYLEPTQETSIICGSVEAVRLTNTAGTQGKDHKFIVDFDRDYLIGEIKTRKVSFDYYHAQKRQQTGKGLPKVELVYNGTRVGNTVGGGDTVASLSPLVAFSATEINNGWWHLEYFITALTPTFGDHGDNVISEDAVVNGVRIIDSNIYDHDSINAYIVIDNFQLSTQASTKLGLFNRGTTITTGNYYWMKVAWAGEVHSVTITFSDADSDDPCAIYTPSAKSPFYIKALHAGTIVATCTMELGDEHQILSISNTLTIT